MSSICQLSADDKLKSIPIILRDYALNYFSSNSNQVKSFKAATNILRSWYNSDDRRSRILGRWQDMRLAISLGRDPDEFQVTVFRKFVVDLISLQKQLDTYYHDDHFLRDRLLTSIDIPLVQAAFKDRLPRNSQQAIKGIAIQLREHKKSAGVSAACIAQEEDLGFYSLDKYYHGKARRPTKKPFKPGGDHGGNAHKEVPVDDSDLNG